MTQVSAMVFAAGKGTRLKPYTDHHPKALVPVDGQPMLQRVLARIRQAGITRAVVNVHHLAGQITDWLGHNQPDGLQVTVSDEQDRLLDTGGGLLKASRHFAGSDAVLVHNADILTDLPLATMVRRHLESGADITLLVKPRTTQRYLVFRDTRLEGWTNIATGQTLPPGFETAPHHNLLAYGGIHVLSPRALDALKDYARDHGPVFSVTPFFIDSVRKLDIRAYCPQEDYTWFDIGKADTLEQARAAVAGLKSQKP